MYNLEFSQVFFFEQKSARLKISSFPLLKKNWSATSNKCYNISIRRIELTDFELMMLHYTFKFNWYTNYWRLCQFLIWCIGLLICVPLRSIFLRYCVTCKMNEWNAYFENFLNDSIGLQDKKILMQDIGNVYQIS